MTWNFGGWLDGLGGGLYKFLICNNSRTIKVYQLIGIAHAESKILCEKILI